MTATSLDLAAVKTDSTNYQEAFRILIGVYSIDEVDALIGSVGSSTWGSIGGTLSNQTDLQNALNAKASSSHTHSQSEITNLVSDLAAKQSTLVSSENIKTINSVSLLGSGNIDISGGGGTTVESVFKGTYAPGAKIVHVGDSNTDNAFGRPGWNTAVQKEWYTLGGWLYGCTDINLGQNGSEIQGWTLSIGTPTASTTLRGNANAVVNNDPDLIIVSLGTNELIYAARRAAEGLEATMQANFDTLIEFFLDNTDADILLRMPNPFGQPNNFADFANQAAADAASAQLRRVHLAWKARNPRVRLYDSHLALFGTENTSITTDSLDPETNGRLLYDDLHPTDLGYRRIAQDIADLCTGIKGRVRSTLRQTPDSALTSPIWSETVYLSQIESGGTIMNIPLDPIDYMWGPLSSVRTEDQSIPSTSQHLLAATRVSLSIGAVDRIYQAGGASGVLKCFCHNSGVVRTMTTLTRSNRVTATAGNYYDQATPVGLSSPFTSDDIGPVTFWVESADYVPTAYTRNKQKEEIVLHYKNFDSPPVYADKIYWRPARQYTNVSIKGFCVTAPSSNTQWQLYHWVSGTPTGIATCTFGSGQRTADPAQTIATLNVGDEISIVCINAGGGGAGFSFSLLGTGQIY